MIDDPEAEAPQQLRRGEEEPHEGLGGGPVAHCRGDGDGEENRGAGAGKAAKLLPVTPMGRYMKVLLSSSEFLFID